MNLPVNGLFLFSMKQKIQNHWLKPEKKLGSTLVFMISLFFPMEEKKTTRSITRNWKRSFIRNRRSFPGESKPILTVISKGMANGTRYIRSLLENAGTYRNSAERSQRSMRRSETAVSTLSRSSVQRSSKTTM